MELTTNDDVRREVTQQANPPPPRRSAHRHPRERQTRVVLIDSHAAGILGNHVKALR
ncbi:MAG: hypothetical protein L0H96_01945 [Humibacillus sp.]|nr:hypothetical protein [Humibacillus sp.]